MEKQKYNFHSINTIWPLYSFVTGSEVHDFRMMVVIYQPSNQFSHSFYNCSNFLELSVEILERKRKNNINLVFKGYVSNSLTYYTWPLKTIWHIKFVMLSLYQYYYWKAIKKKKVQFGTTSKNTIIELDYYLTTKIFKMTHKKVLLRSYQKELLNTQHCTRQWR